MTRIRFAFFLSRLLVSSTMFFVLLTCLSGGQLIAEERPNIVFLLADDQCTNSLGCYGNREVKTPNIDRLARQGVAFDNHYDTTAICMASRANIMTGMVEYKNGCNFDHGPLMRSHWVDSYPMLLRRAGYRTAIAGKIGFVVADRPGDKGQLPQDDFDAWGAGPGQTSYVTSRNPSMAKYAKQFPHSTRAYGAFGRDFIRDAARRKVPFCLSISFKAPHRPVTPDPVFDEVYAGVEFTKPANFGREYGQHFSPQSRTGRQYVRFHEWKYSSDYSQVMAQYHQQIFAIDVAVDMIRHALEETSVADNTVIIYTSDNGFLCGAHGYGSKVLPYEEASRVPLIIYDPRGADHEQNQRCSALTGNIDIAATILALAKVARPENMDGRSLVPLYAEPNGQQAVHEQLPLINVWGPKSAHSLSIVTRDWKYIYWPYDEGDFEPSEELYHTAEDPLELKNLLHDPAATQQLAAMRNRYDAQVRDWERNAVPYNNYQAFAKVFRRHGAQP